MSKEHSEGNTMTEDPSDGDILLFTNASTVTGSLGETRQASATTNLSSFEKTASSQSLLSTANEINGKKENCSNSPSTLQSSSEQSLSSEFTNSFILDTSSTSQQTPTMPIPTPARYILKSCHFAGFPVISSVFSLQGVDNSTLLVTADPNQWTSPMLKDYQPKKDSKLKQNKLSDISVTSIKRMPLFVSALNLHERQISSLHECTLIKVVDRHGGFFKWKQFTLMGLKAIFVSLKFSSLTVTFQELTRKCYMLFQKKMDRQDERTTKLFLEVLDNFLYLFDWYCYKNWPIFTVAMCVYLPNSTDYSYNTWHGVCPTGWSEYCCTVVIREVIQFVLDNAKVSSTLPPYSPDYFSSPSDYSHHLLPRFFPAFQDLVNKPSENKTFVKHAKPSKCPEKAYFSGDTVGSGGVTGDNTTTNTKIQTSSQTSYKPTNLMSLDLTTKTRPANQKQDYRYKDCLANGKHGRDMIDITSTESSVGNVKQNVPYKDNSEKIIPQDLGTKKSLQGDCTVTVQKEKDEHHIIRFLKGTDEHHIIRLLKGTDEHHIIKVLKGTDEHDNEKNAHQSKDEVGSCVHADVLTCSSSELKDNNSCENHDEVLSQNDVIVSMAKGKKREESIRTNKNTNKTRKREHFTCFIDTPSEEENGPNNRIKLRIKRSTYQDEVNHPQKTTCPLIISQTGDIEAKWQTKEVPNETTEPIGILNSEIGTHQNNIVQTNEEGDRSIVMTSSYLMLKNEGRGHVDELKDVTPDDILTKLSKAESSEISDTKVNQEPADAVVKKSPREHSRKGLIPAMGSNDYMGSRTEVIPKRSRVFDALWSNRTPFEPRIYMTMGSCMSLSEFLEKYPLATSQIPQGTMIEIDNTTYDACQILSHFSTGVSFLCHKKDPSLNLKNETFYSLDKIPDDFYITCVKPVNLSRIRSFAPKNAYETLSPQEKKRADVMGEAGSCSKIKKPTAVNKTVNKQNKYTEKARNDRNQGDETAYTQEATKVDVYGNMQQSESSKDLIQEIDRLRKTANYLNELALRFEARLSRH